MLVTNHPIPFYHKERKLIDFFKVKVKEIIFSITSNEYNSVSF